jgi:guanylate kinase
MSKPRVVIVSGPSGAGKTTIVKRLLECCPVPLRLSVSATTRPIRAGERDGVDYHFLTNEEFARRKARGEFLECFEVFGRGFWYGTLREEVESSLARKEWALLEIDVNGMQQIVREFPDAITFFVRPSSLEELERRLRLRGTDSQETIKRRLRFAMQEWQQKDLYTHDVVNDQLDEAVKLICDYLQLEYQKTLAGG